MPPHSVTDATDQEIWLHPYDDAAFESLIAMYTTFDPSQRAQGTPPFGEPAIREWLETILNGISVVAWHGDDVIGHVMFVPDGVGRHELAIFVHQDYQRAGIGFELLQTGLGYAKKQDVTEVWLTVESRKIGVQKLYNAVGFTVDNPVGQTRRMSRYL
ncbi:GNAT family N-acetyltransferase [Haladaptatus pallidirubidus]|uniref:GNAT family N-acetyltransferase n=1 Tax=Haladaptatus pallidirubidus TaxID=1008152 RepID=A0AAV3UQI3_9EURY|nr:GNAT family N-acetyltransferase [Haladaptatus pallidirubidus]